MNVEEKLIDEFGMYIKWNKNYIVMPNGDVFSLRKGIFLSKSNDRGYNVVTVGMTIRCCRIVALHYVKRIEGCNIVNHIDGDKLNDHYTNLEWTTHSGNATHAHKIGLMKYPELNRKDLSIPIVQSHNGIILATFPSANEAARQTGTSQRWISECANGGGYRESGGIKKWVNCKSAGGYQWNWQQVKEKIQSLQ